MKDEAMKVKEMEQKRMNEGSKLWRRNRRW
jgi:hypothetical protein